MSRFSGKKGKKFPGADLAYDHEPNGEGGNEPTPLFPEYSVPCVKPLSLREKSEVDRYRQLRERFHESPFFTVLDAAGILAKKGTAARTQSDPFYGMASYAEKYQKKRRTIPKLEGRPYVLKFFPRDLWQTIQPNYKPDGLFGGIESLRKHGLKRGFEDEDEEDEDDTAKRRKGDDDEEGSRKGDREGDDLDEDEEQDEQLVDDDFSEDDDEMGGDYNAEQYFDGGDDDGDGDAFGDGGGGGDDNDTY